MSDVIFENNMFNIRIVTFVDPILNEQVEGYGIFNKETGVREAEVRRLYNAKQLAAQYLQSEEELKRDMKDDLLRDMGGFNA